MTTTERPHVGRGYTMPVEVFEAICADVATGTSVVIAAELRGYTDRTVHRHTKANPELAAALRQARAAGQARQRRHGVNRRGCCDACTEAARRRTRLAVAESRRRKRMGVAA